MRLPAELLETLDAFAAAQRVSRSALIRGLLEDGLDAGELPRAPAPSSAEMLAELRAAEDERLREMTRN